MESEEPAETPLNRAIRLSGRTGAQVGAACQVSRQIVSKWRQGVAIPERHRAALISCLGEERTRRLYDAQTPATGCGRQRETPKSEGEVLRSAARVLSRRGRRELAASVAAEAGTP